MLPRFCPLCSKNRVQSKLKAYQIDESSAIFLCPDIECTYWPFGEEGHFLINRPKLGENWEKDWDNVESKYFENEQSDPVFEFSTYTPPQTPGTEICSKDAVSTNTVKTPQPVASEASVNIDDNFLIDGSNLLDFPVDTSIDDITKPKLKSFSQVCYNVQKSAKGYVLKKNECSIVDDKKPSSIKISDSKQVTTVDLLSTKVHNNKLDNNLVESDKIIGTNKSNSNILSQKKSLKKKIPIKSFDFDEIKKSMNVKPSNENNSSKLQVISKKPGESCTKKINLQKCKIIKIQTLRKLENSRIIKKISTNSFHSGKVLNLIPEKKCVQETLSPSKDKKSQEKMEIDSTDYFDLDEFLNQQATNLNTNTIEEFVDTNKINDQLTNCYSVDSESILGSTNSPPDSGIGTDQDLTELDVSINDLYSDIDYFSPECNLKSEKLNTENSVEEVSLVNNSYENELTSHTLDFM